MSKVLKMGKGIDVIQAFIDANHGKLDRYKVGTDGLEFEAKEGEDLDYTEVKNFGLSKGFIIKEEK